MCSCSAGIASATSKPAASEAERSGRRSTASTIPPQAPPSRHAAASPADQWDAEPVDAVAELRQQRRQNRERAEHRDCDDDDRRVPEGCECRIARQEQPGHRNHDGEPGDEHRPSGGCGGNLEGVLRASAGRTLLALSAQIEERVVHADGEPDQQHDRERFLCKRNHVTRQRREPEGREDRRECKQ